MGRLRQKLVAALLSCLLPCTALAEWNHIPKWELKKIEQQEWACYDFDSAKKLKLLDTRVDGLVLDLETRTASLTLVQISLEARTYHIKVLNQRVADRDKELEIVNEQLADTEDRAKSAEKFNVFGDALPWVITAIVLSAVGGGAFTLWATSK